VNVLLVEDSEVVRREIARMIGKSPAVDEIMPAATVAEARERLTERDFDAWVLDFELGDGTALELLDDLVEGLPRFL
jgi:DNA-binding NarL/FixJ family response regulator